MGEEWRTIQGFLDYQVSNLGRVRSLNKILKTPLSLNGDYPCVCLYKDEQRFTKKVHRLVACAFIENPLDLETVDHIDRNRLNNHVSNLRWANRSTQALNRNKRDIVYKTTNTNEHHISYWEKHRRYVVQKRDIRLCKYFKTLEEAIQYRDNLLR